MQVWRRFDSMMEAVALETGIRPPLGRSPRLQTDSSAVTAVVTNSAPLKSSAGAWKPPSGSKMLRSRLSSPIVVEDIVRNRMNHSGPATVSGSRCD